jgi:transposase
VAECYVPSKETMGFTELVRFRANLVRQRTRMKNRIHAYLLMNNTSIGDESPFSKGFIEKVRKIDDVRVQSYLRLIDGLNREIREASIIIRQKAGSNADAPLMTIPGISFFSALLIVSEIGEIGRFEDSSSLVGYSVGAIHSLVRREDVPRSDHEIREQIPEVDNGPVHQSTHEG